MCRNVEKDTERGFGAKGLSSFSSKESISARKLMENIFSGENIISNNHVMMLWEE